jgi:PAS domain-containing protein
MVTGAVSEEFAASIIKFGANDYILKDRLNRLPVAIDTALKQKKAENEKRETEKRIMQSEANLRTIFENTSEGFLLMDSNGIVKAFN